MEVWIKSLHSFDDAEVYNNIKNSRPQLEPWQKNVLEEWKAQHQGEEPDKNWNLSMDGLMMTENPETSVYAKQLAETTADEPNPQKELLYEELSELPEEDQDSFLEKLKDNIEIVLLEDTNGPISEVEGQIADLQQELLKRTKAGPNQNYDDLGKEINRLQKEKYQL